MEANKNVGHLEEEAIKRKERLKSLKRKLDANEDDDHGNVKPNQSIHLPKPKFRSYKPSDEGLKDYALEGGKVGDVESEIKSQLDAALKPEVIETLDVANLAPRKPDWDLKRDAAKKLERLEKKTQRAIAELIRDRLRREGNDLAVNVAIGAELEAAGDEE